MQCAPVRAAQQQLRTVAARLAGHDRVDRAEHVEPVAAKACRTLAGDVEECVSVLPPVRGRADERQPRKRRPVRCRALGQRVEPFSETRA